MFDATGRLVFVLSKMSELGMDHNIPFFQGMAN